MERFETFSTLIAKINKNIRKIKAREMKEFELKSSHVQYIYHLHKEKSLSLKQLSDMCIADKAAVSRVIEELQSFGYVEQSKSGRYKLLYSLTETGEEVAKKLSSRIVTVLEAVGHGLSDDERIGFYKNLTEISENLQRIADSI